ncbi:MAG TPA: hypothetical protein VK399_08405 [Longimicrobiaceae bacterium]|jgi:NAD-dependent SIR2 family protein deacetylase|nr:hypothetical protein [Longimicrobiaceae bacterium]
MSKTVFVLGAGFSAPARMPVQADLMRDVLGHPSRAGVRKTYKTLFNLLNPDEMANIPLEDVFTMLDRARRSGETIRGLSRKEIERSHTQLLVAITRQFKPKLTRFGHPAYTSFFSELVRVRIGAGDAAAQEEDPFSIITLNWDTIPEIVLSRLGRLGTSPPAVIDYTCYDYDLAGRPGHVPSINRKAREKFNIKVMKLHGSLNWLVCNSCGRLFSAEPERRSSGVVIAGKRHCRFCKDVVLDPLIITPTLVKDLAQTHLRMVWHNALMDLQEAERIVFIGYSFPMADFEFRYVLMKAVAGNADVSVRVLLYPDDTCKDCKRLWERDTIQERYRSFFGGRDLDFSYGDSGEFMTQPHRLWNW